jgi:hypothetical protein
MKARLVPIYFVRGRDEVFDLQLSRLKELLSDRAEFLLPVGLGERLPEGEAVIFPQFLGEAYHKYEEQRMIWGCEAESSPCSPSTCIIKSLECRS